MKIYEGRPDHNGLSEKVNSTCKSKFHTED